MPERTHIVNETADTLEPLAHPVVCAVAALAIAGLTRLSDANNMTAQSYLEQIQRALNTARSFTR